MAQAMHYNTMTTLTCGAPSQLTVEYMQCEVMHNTYSFECAAADGYMQEIVEQLKQNEAATAGLKTVYKNQDYWINCQRTDHVNSSYTNVGACTGVCRRRRLIGVSN